MPVKQLLLAGVALATVSGPLRAEDGPAPASLFAPQRPAVAAANAAPVAPAAASGAKAPFIVEPPAGAKAAAPAGNAVNAIDLSALRYYASQNDLTRVAAEIRLLRSRHPDWEPPQDLFSESRSQINEQPFWDLFSKHDLQGLHKAIADQQAKTPDWQPSPDLAGKLQLADAHDQLVAASDGKRWGDVLGVAAANRGLLTCGDVDALWRTAEALKQTGDEAHATDAYRYVLTTCDNPGERLATVQKASAVLTAPGAVDGLVALGRRGPDGRGEFDSLRLDPVRARIGDASAGKPGATVSPADLDAVAASANAAHAPGDMQLLGWYYYGQKNYGQAEAWFRQALAVKPEPKSSEGLVLALREEGKLPEALDLAMKTHDLAPDNRHAFVQLVSSLLVSTQPAVVPTPDKIAAFTAAVEADKDATGAQAYGWWLMKSKQAAAAEPWFQKSMAWQPGQDAAIGLIIAAKQLGHAKVVADLTKTYSGQYPRVAELVEAMRPRGGAANRGGGERAVRTANTRGAARTQVASASRGGGGEGADNKGWDASADAIISTYQSGQYDRALAMMDSRKAGKSEPRGLTVVRGWAQFHRGDWEGAERTFGALEQRSPDRDSERGLQVIREGYLPPALR